MIFEIIIEN